jgi:fatty acid desaturase
VLRLYLLAEHGRCLEVEDMFLNTRTTLTTRVVRFLAWNMPYHAEHHAMPSVPFHKLPVLHDMTAAHLGQVSDGYSGFSKSYVASFRD